MTTAHIEMTSVNMREKFHSVYEMKEILGGLIKYWVKIKSDSMGKELVISTDEYYDRIILNGKEVHA